MSFSVLVNLFRKTFLHYSIIKYIFAKDLWPDLHILPFSFFLSICEFCDATFPPDSKKVRIQEKGVLEKAAKES